MTEIANEIVFDKYKIGERRFIAAILDAIVLSAPLLAITANVKEGSDSPFLFWLTLIYPLIRIAYSVLCHYYYGQTLGKGALNIKVFDISEEGKLSLKQSLYRDSIWILVELSVLLAYILQSNNLFTDSAFFAAITSLSGSFATYWIVIEIVTMLTNKKRRAVHDYLAGTVVIRTK